MKRKDSCPKPNPDGRAVVRAGYSAGEPECPLPLPLPHFLPRAQGFCAATPGVDLRRAWRGPALELHRGVPMRGASTATRTEGVL